MIWALTGQKFLGRNIESLQRTYHQIQTLFSEGSIYTMSGFDVNCTYDNCSFLFIDILQQLTILLNPPALTNLTSVIYAGIVSNSLFQMVRCRLFVSFDGERKKLTNTHAADVKLMVALTNKHFNSCGKHLTSTTHEKNKRFIDYGELGVKPLVDWLRKLQPLPVTWLMIICLVESLMRVNHLRRKATPGRSHTLLNFQGFREWPSPVPTTDAAEDLSLS